MLDRLKAEVDCTQNHAEEQPWDSIGAQSGYEVCPMLEGFGDSGPSSLPGLTDGRTATIAVRPSYTSLREPAIGASEEPQGMSIQMPNDITNDLPFGFIDPDDQHMVSAPAYYPGEDQAKQMLPPQLPPPQFTRQFSDQFDLVNASRQS